MRAMKKKLQREGVFKEMKQRRAYEKPSEKKARLLNESTRRFKKMLRKKLEIQGY
jgi:small subunit ribosomal protein S21